MEADREQGSSDRTTHADGNEKNSTAKASRKEDSSAARWLSSVRSSPSGEERAQREEAYQTDGPRRGNPQCYGRHTEPKQFTRAGLGHDVEKPRYDLAPDYEHQRNERE